MVLPAAGKLGWLNCHSRGFFCRLLSLLILVGLCGQAIPEQATAASPPSWRSDAIEQALAPAGTNRQELVNALRQVPAVQREGLQFLLENMPPRDLQTLTADFLLENLALAYKAREEAPWAKRLPTAVFLDDILPYASLTERRDNWRKRLNGISAPLVKDCKSPSEAAQVLNQKLFSLLNVRYSTQRRRADQGPFETMDSGIATCTGLAILLVDACRSVGVPARVVGTPLWANNSGNHTWVEVWDGDWHFMGAAEPDPNGLDRGWFVGNAAQALKDDPQHAIYASSFQKTGLSFPMVWTRRADYVSAVNVTERYASKPKPPDASKTKLVVRVLDRPVGQRLAAKVIVTGIANAAVRFDGTSMDESADMNDSLAFELPKERTYAIDATKDGNTQRQYFTTGTNAQDSFAIYLGGIPPVTIPSPSYKPPPITKPLKPADEAKLKQALTDFFTSPTNQQATWKFPKSLDELLRDNEPAARHAAWESFRAAPIHSALRRDFDAHQVQFEKHLSPYTVRTVGTRPTNGWALFIALHGGGNAPKQVNDSQWRVMQRYYRDHPEAGGYLYVALRAPNDTWNGFYDNYVYPLVANVIRQFMLFEDLDPNKVFIMGYSHGGYGAFAIGPKMPDRFAAIQASAGAPTDGETTAKTLRNTVFTCMVGEKDTMYGRYDRDKKFDATIKELRGDRTDIYPVTVQFIAGNGHTGLPDRDKIAEMYPAVRNPVPRELTWLMTDGVIRDFFWLSVPAPGKGGEIDATCRDNRLTVTTTTNVAAASVLLDSRLVDFKRPLKLELNGKTSTHKLQPSLRTLCETLQRRGDPDLAFTAQLDLLLAGASPKR